MQMIVFSGLIAILASVSAECDVGKTVKDFDFNKVSTVQAVCWDCGFESRQYYGCVSLSSVVFFRQSFMRRADHLSRIVLSSAACPVSVIVKPCKRGHDSLLGRSSKSKIKIIIKNSYVYAASVSSSKTRCSFLLCLIFCMFNSTVNNEAIHSRMKCSQIINSQQDVSTCGQI